jgi:hypothetical protein
VSINIADFFFFFFFGNYKCLHPIHPKNKNVSEPTSESSYQAENKRTEKSPEASGKVEMVHGLWKCVSDLASGLVSISNVHQEVVEEEPPSPVIEDPLPDPNAIPDHVCSSVLFFD